MGYRIINGKAYPVGNIGGFQGITSQSSKSNNSTSFKDTLNKVIDEKRGYTLSKHAADRLQDINFSESDMMKIGEGFQLAENKGSKNSVMVYKDVALVASIENRTVITAVDKNRAESNVFTNVDSVVIL